ncbi:alpha-L-fucosidase [candidate division KSB1 bacterium]|nr:alpha-L-fucosidase [candidate division KSB1 bacterium]
MNFLFKMTEAILIACIFFFNLNAQERTVHEIESGIFQPEWQSLAENYQCPDWFRDAKFGIWAHWSAQCVPEQGDWYARGMYIQGSRQYDYHVKTYGHPSVFGFMEIDNLWKAEKWQPDSLMALYKAAGAKYFVALANHHDNFDNYNSKFHQWNSVNVGPEKDIVGTWEKVARKNGLYFGVSNHSAHAWHWFQTAYGYDYEGPKAGIRYDAAMLTKKDGKDRWWEGLDPQELYTGPSMVMPDGMTNAEEVAEWHKKNDRVWTEESPANNPQFVQKWFLRCQDLLDTYRPDLLYLDDYQLPFGQTGLDIVAHFYNANKKWNDGELQSVVTAKNLEINQKASIVEDYERGYVEDIQEYPWQTCTCIGSWHYNKEIFLQNKYKTVEQVVHQLIDIVSKNGNLLLSIPMKGDGTIDSLEVKFLKEMAAWMKINSEALYDTRPWKIFGEGPTEITSGMFNENKTKFTAHDIRFTQTDKSLYALIMGIPTEEKIILKSLAAQSSFMKDVRIAKVTLLGSTEIINWTQTKDGLKVELPEKLPCKHAVVLKLEQL